MDFGCYVFFLLVLIVLSPAIALWAIREISPLRRRTRYIAQQTILSILDSHIELEGQDLLCRVNLELLEPMEKTDFTFLLAQLEHQKAVERRIEPLVTNCQNERFQAYRHYFRSTKQRIHVKPRPLSVVETLANLPGRFLPAPWAQIDA